METLADRLRYWATLDAPIPGGIKNDCAAAAQVIVTLQSVVYKMQMPNGKCPDYLTDVERAAVRAAVVAQLPE